MSTALPLTTGCHCDVSLVESPVCCSHNLRYIIIILSAETVKELRLPLCQWAVLSVREDLMLTAVLMFAFWSM